MYAVAGAAVAVFEYPDVIPDDPFGEIISKLLILVVYVILVFGLTLMLISVVFPELIISTTWLKRLAVVGILMVVTLVVTEIFFSSLKSIWLCSCSALLKERFVCL